VLLNMWLEGQGRDSDARLATVEELRAHEHTYAPSFMRTRGWRSSGSSPARGPIPTPPETSSWSHEDAQNERLSRPLGIFPRPTSRWPRLEESYRIVPGNCSANLMGLGRMKAEGGSPRASRTVSPSVVPRRRV
jgi:hypothetical protein